MERISSLSKVLELKFRPRKSGFIAQAFNEMHKTDVIFLTPTCIHYLLLHNKLLQNLVAKSSKHLFSHSFCGQESTGGDELGLSAQGFSQVCSEGIARCSSNLKSL